LWAFARYDLGLSFEEFEELTPGMFKALAKRRNIRIKYERFANAQTAAAVYNTLRTKDEDQVVEAMDFVRDEKQAAAKERLRDAKRFCSKVMQVPISTPRARLLEIRAKAIGDLKKDGFEDAEEIMNKTWPHLKPKDGE
jgi:hypothetical protein